MTLLLIVLSLAIDPSALQDVAAAPRDIAVYRAVLAEMYQRQIDRFNQGQGLPPGTPVLVFDRTIAMCHTPSDSPKQMGCLSDERVVQEFLGKNPRRRTPIFDGLIKDDTRLALALAFTERNATNQPFPAGSLEKAIGVSLEAFDEAIKREPRKGIPRAIFAVPAYASDGHALAYGSYTCGGGCGIGWLFLLKQDGESWKVIKTELLWVS